jgi:hypothetical protein
VSNDVHVVLFYYLFQCFWISCIMIYQMKLIQQILLVYHLVLFTSLHNK